jgi:tetratricopeptide (TPR) repeat protein
MSSARSLLGIVCFAFAISMTSRVASSAQSETRNSAESHFLKGKKAYTLGRFDEAIAEFEKAYDADPAPIFIFNIAQSHKQNGNYQRALFFYRRYLQENPKAKDRAGVEERIRAMETRLADQTASAPKPVAAPPPPPPPPPDATVETSPPAPPPPTRPTVEASPPPAAAPPSTISIPSSPAPPPPMTPPSSKPSRGLVVAGVTVGSVGVAMLVGGILAGVHASRLHDEVTCAGCTFDSSKDGSSSRFRTLSYVAYAVGGTALTTGAVLTVVGTTAKNNASVAFTPWLAPDATGAAVAGRF